MVTPLQKAFATSKIIRRGMNEIIAEQGLDTGRGYKRVWNDIYKDVFTGMTEAQIKSLLFDFLHCYDITDAERAEILNLLRLSQTAFTEEQSRRLQDILF